MFHYACNSFFFIVDELMLKVETYRCFKKITNVTIDPCCNVIVSRAACGNRGWRLCFNHFFYKDSWHVLLFQTALSRKRIMFHNIKKPIPLRTKLVNAIYMLVLDAGLPETLQRCLHSTLSFSVWNTAYECGAYSFCITHYICLSLKWVKRNVTFSFEYTAKWLLMDKKN